MLFSSFPTFREQRRVVGLIVLIVVLALTGSVHAARATTAPPPPTSVTSPPAVTTTTSKSMKYLPDRLFISGVGRVGSTLQCNFVSNVLSRGAGIGASPGTFTWFDDAKNRLFSDIRSEYIVRPEDVGRTVTCALKTPSADLVSTPFSVTNFSSDAPTGKLTISAPSPTSQANLTCNVETSSTVLGYYFVQGPTNVENSGTSEQNDGSSIQDANFAYCVVYIENPSGRTALTSERRQLPPPPPPKLVTPMRIVGSGRVGTNVSCTPPKFKPQRALIKFNLVLSDGQGSSETFGAAADKKITRKITKDMLATFTFVECIAELDNQTVLYTKRVFIK